MDNEVPGAMPAAAPQTPHRSHATTLANDDGNIVIIVVDSWSCCCFEVLLLMNKVRECHFKKINSSIQMLLLLEIAIEEQLVCPMIISMLKTITKIKRESFNNIKKSTSNCSFFEFSFKLFCCRLSKRTQNQQNISIVNLFVLTGGGGRSSASICGDSGAFGEPWPTSSSCEQWKYD